MPVTMTIKQVPDQVAERLRRRAAENRRSLQRELLLIVERAADEDVSCAFREPEHPVYHLAGGKAGKASSAVSSRKLPRATPSDSGKLTLEALWQRARDLGGQMPGESAEIIRRDRDARDGR